MNSIFSKQAEGSPGILGDFINRVVRLTEDSMRAELVNVPGMPADIKAYHAPGSHEIKLMTIPQGPTIHYPDDLHSLCSIAMGQEATFWLSEGRIHLVFKPEDDKADRREGAILNLKLTPQFAELVSMNNEEGVWFNQKDCIHFLRSKMAGANTAAGDALLIAVRTLKFKKVQESDSTVGHGHASIGKQLQLEAAGACDIPEEVSFAARLFQNEGMDFHFYVDCTVDVDVEQAAIRITPKAGQIEKSYYAALKKAANDIRKACGDDLFVFFGKPW